MAADKTTATLNRLIAVCRDGEEVYGYAAEKVSRPQLEELLRATAGLHREISDALWPHVRDIGAPAAEGGTFAGQFGQLEGGLEATWASDAERALVPELEQAEQAIVQAFERALAEPMAATAKALVAGKLEILRATQARFVEVARRAADA
jgi:uncharacterized protein (TIGR02284 family)